MSDRQALKSAITDLHKIKQAGRIEALKLWIADELHQRRKGDQPTVGQASYVHELARDAARLLQVEQATCVELASELFTPPATSIVMELVRTFARTQLRGERGQ